MIITFGQAKKELARYAGKAGKCRDDDQVDLFVKEVIQQLLFRGANGNLRKWVFLTQNGMFTAPPDLELPLKIKIDGEVASSFDKWYEFYDNNTLSNCVPCEEGIFEEPNVVFTAFDLPPHGARILAKPICKEALGSPESNSFCPPDTSDTPEEAHFVITGRNEFGEEVFMPHKGTQLKGEYLSINKFKPKFTQTCFTAITGIEKTVTNHYVDLMWFDPHTKLTGLLGKYKPSDTHPSFRRFRINGLACDRCFKVTILGRVRFCENYHDNDVIPISSLRGLRLMAQHLQSEDNDDIQTADYKNKRIAQVIQDENNYKRTTSATIDFFRETSPGRIPNII